MRSYFKCLPLDDEQNKHVKTLAYVAHTERAVNPHFFAYKEGYYAVNEVGEKTEGPMTEEVHVDQVCCGGVTCFDSLAQFVA